jgi:hypothetical protein
MKITEVKNNKNQYLYEGLTPKYQKTMMLWESVGRTIVEAQMSPEDIKKLFQQVEKDQTAAGGNRTVAGQAKDVAGAVANAYQDLKAKVANSAIMQNFDQQYEQAAEKLKQATGGDAGAMQYVEKYRTFAKKHPMAQSLIYGTLIAAAGISGAGAGGAAALGLFKMADKLLQGEKFSTAAVAGAETGIAAFAASKLGDLIKGVGPGEQIPAPTDGQPISTAGYDFANKDYYLSPTGTQTVAVPKGYGSPWEEGTKAYSIRQELKSGSGLQESVVYTSGQVTALFESIAIQEGLWDQFKQKTANIVGSPEERAEVGQQIKQGVSAVAGAVAQKAQTVGKNITTKITADKLNKAWTAAGSPTDSDAIAKFLTTQGVNPDVVNSAMSTVGVSSAADVEQEQPAVDTSKLPDVSSLTPEQKQALLAKLDQLDKAEAGSASSTKIRTGGKVAGQVSQTPNAIRKRQARLASKSVNAQPTDAPDYTTSMAELIKQRQAKGMTESTEYMHFKTKLRKALSK